MTASWVQTYGGYGVELERNTPIVLPILVYAHALARINRFSGHTIGDHGYSVAQHSVLVAAHCPPGLELEGLMHDAHEAIIGDITSPVKAAARWYGISNPPVGGAFDALDRLVSGRVRASFGLPIALDPRVVQVDIDALLTEARDLMGGQVRPWGVEGTPWPETIVPLDAKTAEMAFLTAFERYAGVR